MSSKEKCAIQEVPSEETKRCWDQNQKSGMGKKRSNKSSGQAIEHILSPGALIFSRGTGTGINILSF